MKKLSVIIVLLTVFLSNAVLASAHVTVKPAEVGVAERLNFAVSVPTEEDIPTTVVRLVVPEGLKSVRPNVKPGWIIELMKTGEGENARVSEIVWSGGSIPAEQRDEFIFSAQAPAEPVELQWKAYQTYADGTVVSWDASPEMVKAHEAENPVTPGAHDETAPKPYSVTKVINDIAEENAETKFQANAIDVSNNLLLYGVVLALAMSGASLYFQWKKK